MGAAQRCIAWAGASTTAVACPGAKAGGDASRAGLCGLLQPWKSPTLTHACRDLGGNKARAGTAQNGTDTGERQGSKRRQPASVTQHQPQLNYRAGVLPWQQARGAVQAGNTAKHGMHRCQGSNSLCRTSNPYKSPVAVTQLDHGSAAALSFGSSTPPQIPAIAAKGKTCMLERVCAACAGRSTQYG